MKREINKIKVWVIVLLLGGALQSSAQQAPDQFDDIFGQMEQLFQEFSQGSFMQMDSLMLGFGFSDQLDSLEMQFGNLPGFMFSDTLLLGPNGFSDDYGMDLQGEIC